MKPFQPTTNFLLGILFLFFTSTITAQNVKDTRLMSNPAISKNKIAFIYAEDLWVANRDGSNPIRLTIDEGIESNPIFSPDGSKIAFSAEYDGNIDVFIIDVNGGVPKRLTWHPYADLVRSFDETGKNILFASRRHSHVYHYRQLYTISIDGGPVTKLPLPTAHSASYSPDAKYIAYTPFGSAHTQWKNYRGGRQGKIWIYDVKTHEVDEIPKPATGSNDTNPQWIRNTVYFRSDRNGEFNIYSYDMDSKQVTQHTFYKDFPVLAISSDNNELIYEQAGYLHTYNPAVKQKTKLTIGIATDLLELRPRFVSGNQYIRSVGISPSGKRLVMDFRGEIVTVPVKKGDVNNISQTAGVHEKDPQWSPNGKHIAYFSDASGEYELHIKNIQDNSVEKISIKGNGFYAHINWSPDSKKICYTDNSKSIYIVDVASKKSTKIASDVLYGIGAFRDIFGSWSHDSKWVTYTQITETYYQKAFVYSVDENKSFAISDGLSNISEVVFDPSGKYIYLTASTDAGPLLNWFDLSSQDMESSNTIYLITLQKETISPLAKKNDEEVIEVAEKKDSSAKEEEETALKIDWDGIEHRIIALPIRSGNYSNLQIANEGELFYLSRNPNSSFFAAQPIYKFSLKDQKAEEITQASSFEFSSDGKQMLYYKNGDYGVTAIGSKTDNSVNTTSIQVKIDPVKEWNNIFEEAWRVNRDYFYDPGMHGINWKSMKKKYKPFLAHVTNRSDLYRMMQWMFSELGVGHHRFADTGDRLNSAPYIGGGLLGADYKVNNNRYQFSKIYGGLNWNPNLRSPLTEPGVNVTVGDYLLSVNGKNVTANQNLYAFFENTAGKIVTLEVSAKADGTNRRTVKVVPIYGEIQLRNRAWVENNIKKVDEATNGQVAYVYVPNTAGQGHEYFKRYFFPQTNKKAVIIDERFNGGGLLADYYLDILQRSKMSGWNFRYGKDLRTPSASIDGPKVMLVNEGAGSGGDYLPWAFKRQNMGTIVGKRTWGGLVGILGYPEFIDGGVVTAPNIAFWDENGYTVENEGVAPDVEVDQLPKLVIQGRDPQLEKAIEIALKQLKENPKVYPKRPAYPIRARKEQNKF
ncbi:S41 family peptidase [uncultured Kordia sp.]|uniref:S41 family peptidase n=1 Tax=uncultured Kordia sp. TaxID=507699 RepID=UPI0026236926|nr:S41 family peptidase [uncultured Kordia sp.]